MVFDRTPPEKETEMNPLEKRVVQLSYKHNLSHISSCLNCVNLIERIYQQRKPDEPFCLDNSHAALALYVVLQKHGLCDAEEMIEKHGTHAGRDPENGIYVSGGSLGQVATVAIGLALADPNRKVWLVTSDGSCMEGAVHEAMRIARHHCPNLKTFIVFNGRGAYGNIDAADLPRGPEIYDVDENRYPEFLRGFAGHYIALSKEQHQELIKHES